MMYSIRHGISEAGLLMEAGAQDQAKFWTNPNKPIDLGSF